MRNRLKCVRSYRTLAKVVGEFDPPTREEWSGPAANFDDFTTDSLSVPLVPSDSPGTPIQIVGDGNCLPRTASLFLYGTQEHHEEIRYRILKELVEHSSFYLSKELDRGGTVSAAARSFAMFSEFYTGQRLNSQSIKKIYQLELRSITKLGSYMGAWQIAALASISGQVVHSVYPQYGAATVRNELHRSFHPRESSATDSDKPGMHILWTKYPRCWSPLSPLQGDRLILFYFCHGKFKGYIFYHFVENAIFCNSIQNTLFETTDDLL